MNDKLRRQYKTNERIRSQEVRVVGDDVAKSIPPQRHLIWQETVV